MFVRRFHRTSRTLLLWTRSTSQAVPRRIQVQAVELEVVSAVVVASAVVLAVDSVVVERFKFSPTATDHDTHRIEKGSSNDEPFLFDTLVKRRK